MNAFNVIVTPATISAAPPEWSGTLWKAESPSSFQAFRAIVLCSINLFLVRKLKCLRNDCDIGSFRFKQWKIEVYVLVLVQLTRDLHDHMPWVLWVENRNVEDTGLS